MNIKTGQVIDYTDDRECVHEEVIGCGDKIRNQMALRALQTARGFILFAAERFTEKDAPDKMSVEIVGMLKELDKIVCKKIIHDACEEINTEIGEDILKDIGDELKK